MVASAGQVEGLTHAGMDSRQSGYDDDDDDAISSSSTTTYIAPQKCYPGHIGDTIAFYRDFGAPYRASWQAWPLYLAYT